MKKKLVAMAMCTCMALSLFACGKKDNTNGTEEETTTASTSSQTVYTEDDIVDDTASEVNLLDYVTLPEYTGLELTKEVEAVTDEDVTSEASTRQITLTKGDVVVQDGDTTVIDFEGKLDGVAFDGGTATGYELEIGSGSFIDGFEDGLIGVKKGETVDLNLTFPETYSNTDLAGQDVVFTVTVHDVMRAPGEEGDEWYTTYTDYASQAAYLEELRAELETEADETAQYNMEVTALDEVIENATVTKYMKSYVTEGESQYEQYVNMYASLYGVSLSEFIEAQGMTQEDYDNQKANQGISYAQGAMVIMAIAEKAGLKSEDAGYQQILEDLAASNSMDKDALIANYGESLVNTSVMSEYVMDYIIDNSTVTTTTVTAEETTAE